MGGHLLEKVLSEGCQNVVRGGGNWSSRRKYEKVVRRSSKDCQRAEGSFLGKSMDSF